MSELPEHVRRNRGQWDRWADWYATPAREQWAAAQPSWGIWRVPGLEGSQARLIATPRGP
ncbi:MAG: hypothetical protein QOJ63_1225 [Solirubrobacteraceae bacterium]|jgi:hypothetical protein|nr:hypothetical protein [Solirubrobacteraceae bacterium]